MKRNDMRNRLEKVSPDEFSNYAPYSVHFEPLDIYRHNQTYILCPAGKDPEESYIQTGSKDYINGWLYGATQAICGIFRRNLSQFPEVNSYDQEEHQFDMDREDDGTPVQDLNRYEVVFDIAGHHFYCFADAINMHEALGQFFQAHPHITYSMVVDHMEV